MKTSMALMSGVLDEFPFPSPLDPLFLLDELRLFQPNKFYLKVMSEVNQISNFVKSYRVETGAYHRPE